ncbi:MAG: hypothetical protein LKF57_08125 [Bifidobacterium sp.]|jgi:hypothetical protein|nr:hypothetical protein [Bifidobacterium sp.]MCH4210036.1 hypothetical protein [Bifidobacterium sp.]MCI1225438.1 hypothetical protein [Bifidobacterium sp.]
MGDNRQNENDSKQDSRQWYYNTVTGQPEQGMVSPIDQRMGPYDSREDALRAWEIVRRRNQKWDNDDRQWNRWSEGK